MSIKSKLLIIFTIFTLPALSHAFEGNLSDTNPQWLSNNQTPSIDYKVTNRGNTLHFHDINLNIVYKLDPAQSAYELPPEDMAKILNKNPGLSQFLTGIRIANYTVSNTALKADIVYALKYESMFGDFTFDITSSINFQSYDQNSKAKFSKTQTQLTDLKLKLLGRDISDKETLKVPKYVLAIGLDLLIKMLIGPSDDIYYNYM